MEGRKEKHTQVGFKLTMLALSELESAFKALPTDHEFQKELHGMLRNYVCRESPLYFAQRLTEHYRRPNGEGPEIYLKMEDLNPPCFHKMKNAVAQALLAKRLGKKRIIAEVGATEVGVATANVRRVDSNVTSEEASIDWVTNVETSGESNAMGLFNEFVQDKDVRLIGVEAASFLLGNVHNVRRLPKRVVPWIIERLGLSGVGVEHKSLKDLGLAEFYKICDKEALEAYFRLIPLEGLRPSLEASHALAYLEKLCPTLANGTKVVLNFNARGEKEPLLL
ncbi:hypothetical protein LXL04_037447 [Taraxacum kok-saghyz]